MSKKQASNTFGKGLVQDLHPLIVPNDTLTDALNATTVTMNGNEGILQNDMGNGRVESAFLPSGYVPVGIKEYGGIIYIASYNPITNKSQIGSFPSPERNIDQNESGLTNSLQLLNNTYIRTYKFSKFNNSNFSNGLGQLTNKIEIFGDYKVIRSGDKFGFYFNNVPDGSKNILSNYFNFDFNDVPLRTSNNRDSSNGFNKYGGWDSENGVYQNNIVSLSVEVLDNNNNLRDITYQLKRYDDNTVIKYDSDQVTESDMFNAGYFIGDSVNSSWNSVNVERDKKALNTYNNKLFGKLYLVGKVNVIDHIEVSVQPASGKDCDMFPNYQGQCQEDSKNLLFYIDYYYNCPYNYLEKPSINYYYPHFDTINPNNTSNIRNIISGCISEIGTPVYDVYTNLYRQRYAAFIELTDDFPIDIDNTILNFIVIPQMKSIPETAENSISKLTHIATEGSIDLSKIGSGTANIIRWRYLYMGSYMYLNWGLEDYPLESDIITDFRMEFYNLNSSSSDPDYVQYFNKTSYNGSFTETINFNENTIKPRQIYIVKIIRRKNNNDQEIGERIIITTDIYNHLFLKYDDFFPEVSEGTSETLADIQNANEIKINFDISEKGYIKGKTSYDKKLLHIREEDVLNNQFTYTQSNNNIKSFSFDQDENVYIYTTFSSFNTSNTIDINLSISEKYPFELDNINKIEYEIYQDDPTIEDNELETRFGTEDIPIFEEGNVLNLSSDYDKFKLTNDTNNRRNEQGNSSISLVTEYNFPAEAIITYDENPTPITINSEYKTLYEYISSDLINKNILVPWVMVRKVSGRDDYLRYMLVKCVPGTGAISTIKERTAVREMRKNGGLGGFFVDENMNEIQDHLDASGLSNGTFCLVGSPSLFGVGRNNTYQGIVNEVCDATGYDNDDVKGNYFLRPVLKPTETGDERFDESVDQFDGYRAWFYLLWKDITGKYVILNIVYMNKKFIGHSSINPITTWDNGTNIVNGITVISVETAIKMLLNKGNTSTTTGFANRLFFKNNVYGRSKDIYKVNGITYTRDYNTQIIDNINIDNIQLNYEIGSSSISDLIKYYEGDNIDIIKSDEDNIITCIQEENSLKNYLTFKVSLESPDSITTTARSYKINGMDDFINQISQTEGIGGFISFNDNVYTSDFNGNNLNEDIYLFEEEENNTYVLKPKSLVNEQSELIKRLTVYNNDLLIESSLKGQSEKYAHGAKRNSRIVARLGKSLSYVPFSITGYTDDQYNKYDTLI